MSDVILETRNLTKKYKDFYALDNVSISLKKNRIYGFIGENGAGKSTFMKIIAGLTYQTSGDYTLMGATSKADIENKRRYVGTMIENPYLYPGYTVRQNVELQRILVGNPDESATEKVLELVGLENEMDKKARKLSMGMKHRLGVAIAMVGNPQFLILDEPINGLDPKNIVELRNMLKRIHREKECTIFVSSHILTELFLLATDFIFISKGRIIETSTHEELEDKCSKYILLKDSNIPETVTILENHFPGTAYKVMSDDTMRIYGRREMMSELSGYLMKSGIVVSELSEKELSLEEYFIGIIGGGENA